MDVSLSAAARALSLGDALSALKWLGRRTDAAARAMRGTAFAQLGDFVGAKAQLRAALRTLGPTDDLLRARCLAAEAEVALAVGDLRWSAEPVTRAVEELEAAGDRRPIFGWSLRARPFDSVDPRTRSASSVMPKSHTRHRSNERLPSSCASSSRRSAAIRSG